MRRRKALGAGLALAMMLVITTLWAGRVRRVRGRVTDTHSLPLRGAVVQLTNRQNLWIRSAIAGEDGSYRFRGLSPDMDYELRASYLGQWSDAKTLSRFDSREVAEIDLTIPVGGHQGADVRNRMPAAGRPRSAAACSMTLLACSATVWTPAAYRRFGLPGPPL
jgi:hypothetical protein